MADLGLALGDAIPKIINMRSSIADLQDRAKRMRMEEELHTPRKQALEGSVEAQNIANQTNTIALNDAKMNAERRNQPVDLNKLDWTDPFVNVTAQVAQRTGRWSDIPTRGQIEDTQKEMITNPQLYVKDFQEQFNAIQSSKEYTALKRETEIAKANIVEQQKIINTSTNIKEIQKAREEIEKINEASGGTKEQLDVIEAKRSNLLKTMSTFDKSIELKQIFEDYKSLIPNLPPQVQQSLQFLARMGDTEGIRKVFEEQSKKTTMTGGLGLEDKIGMAKEQLERRITEVGVEGLTPQEKELKRYVEKIGRTGTAKLEEVFAKRYEAIKEKGDIAQSRIYNMERLDQLIGDLETGRLTEVGTELANWGVNLGLKIDPNLGNKQASQSILNQTAMIMRNPKGEGGLTGQTSDRDLTFLQQAAGTLNLSKEGRRLLIETMKKLSMRTLEISNMADNYIVDHEQLDVGFEKLVRKFVNENHLFPKPSATQAKGRTSSGNRFIIKEKK